jgi:hypothetical protein
VDRSRIPGVLGGHRKNKIYGALESSEARYWIRKGHYVRQRIFFSTESDVIQAGYRPYFWWLRVNSSEWKKDPNAFKAQRVKAK